MQIYAKNIHSLWLDKDNSLWLGLFLKGALHYIPHLNRTVDYNLLSDEVSSGFCIIEDKNDHIWYGGPSGLFLIDKKKANSRPEKEFHLSVSLTWYSLMTVYFGQEPEKAVYFRSIPIH